MAGLGWWWEWGFERGGDSGVLGVITAYKPLHKDLPTLNSSAVSLDRRFLLPKAIACTWNWYTCQMPQKIRCFTKQNMVFETTRWIV